MIDRARHVPLDLTARNADEADAEIAAIVADAEAHFDPERFWPAHPQDGNLRDGNSSFYFGAAGMVWALDYLQRIGAAELSLDFRPVLPRLLAATQAEMTGFGNYATLGSFLFGDLGTALVAHRLAPSAALADLIHARAEGNARFPVRELMWGLPGSMLACLHMAAMTNEARWQSLYETQAARLLDDLEEQPEGPLWTQDLYGRTARYLGPVHGFAGNMIPLMRGWAWLSEAQRRRVADGTTRTLGGTAHRTDIGTTWKAATEEEREPYLCQFCHGAPGMVSAFGDAPFTSPELERLLVEGGDFAWAAGPLIKGSNLCHGTGGNGYAFLKLYRRTGQAVWLERARAFAMTAIGQCREAREELGRGRYSLWTGDVGLAIYLADCLRGEARFPTLDVF